METVLGTGESKGAAGCRLPPELLVDIFQHLAVVSDLRSAALVCRKWHGCAKEVRWASPSSVMLDAVRLEDRPILAGKVRHLVLHRPQDYDMRWTFPRLRSLAVELSILHDKKSPGALAAFLDRCCCGTTLPPCISLYHWAHGGIGHHHNHRHHHLVLPNAPLRLSDIATLAQRPGLQDLRVWPAPLFDNALLTPQGHQRRKALGPAPFRDLTTLTTRAGAAHVRHLLLLVPRVAALDLHVIDDRSSAVPMNNVLRDLADAQLPRLRQLVVRVDGDFALDFDTLLALTGGGGTADKTAFELRAQRYVEFFSPDVPLAGSKWSALLARLPRVEWLWLPRKCPVRGGDALVVAGLACRHLRCVHLHTVWDIGTLAALRPVTFPHLKTIVMDSVGDKLPEEGFSDLVGRARTLVQLLLDHAPRLSALRLWRATLLDMVVFCLFLERRKAGTRKQPWLACQDSLAVGDW